MVAAEDHTQLLYTNSATQKPSKKGSQTKLSSLPASLLWLSWVSNGLSHVITPWETEDGAAFKCYRLIP